MAQDKKYWEEYIKKTVPEYMQKGEPSKPEPDRVAEFDRHYGINVPKNTVLDGVEILKEETNER